MAFPYNNNVRTDLADEARKLWQQGSESTGKLSGVKCCQENLHGLELTEIEIFNSKGEQALGKVRGKYFSLDFSDIHGRGSENFSNAALAVSEIIKRLMPLDFESVLVAALGNPDITPDALGSLSASSVLVTAHLPQNEFPQFSPIAVFRPGVLGTSGIESSAQIKAVVDLFKASVLIVIDALAGSDADRLCRCIQISDAGISPGSGVGNNRQEVSKSVLGIPVISIGMPTVIDASYFGEQSFKGMFVTPRSIDSLVRVGAKIIGYGINLAVHSGISIDDIDSLIG